MTGKFRYLGSDGPTHEPGLHAGRTEIIVVCGSVREGDKCPHCLNMLQGRLASVERLVPRFAADDERIGLLCPECGRGHGGRCRRVAVATGVAPGQG